MGGSNPILSPIMANEREWEVNTFNWCLSMQHEEKVHLRRKTKSMCLTHYISMIVGHNSLPPTINLVYIYFSLKSLRTASRETIVPHNIGSERIDDEVNSIVVNNPSCYVLGVGAPSTTIVQTDKSVVISTDCLSIVELGSDFNGLSVHRRARWWFQRIVCPSSLDSQTTDRPIVEILENREEMGGNHDSRRTPQLVIAAMTMMYGPWPWWIQTVLQLKNLFDNYSKANSRGWSRLSMRDRDRLRSIDSIRYGEPWTRQEGGQASQTS